MEPTCVDTSLNLNVIPSQHMNVAAEILVEELQRLSCENKRLTETLNHMWENYLALQKHLSEFSQLRNTNFEEEATPSRKRKVESENGINLFGNECEEETLFKRPKHNTSPKVSKVLVRTEASDTSLYVSDGYHWRKYGQKVTRDNPSPRAYFKCSFAPSCPVKKKVQRSVEDQSVLVATYEGEHNHAHQQAEISLSSSQSETIEGSVPASSPSLSPIMNRSAAGPTVTLDLVQSRSVDNAQKSSIHQQFLVQQMATSLTRDPNFTAALATAISGTFLNHTSTEER
ncbi:probable WRKY transcription factor 40 [Gastrolobium bilobum]|uniref:probable WRKY transcription factor 40 n=1 Tax=Gastrolobium bilobum TaxID=150636 RepID=UPI002AB091A9|nr:probable WRKY transcription factor 40 [Gastrolobium bilobum]